MCEWIYKYILFVVATDKKSKDWRTGGGGSSLGASGVEADEKEGRVKESGEVAVILHCGSVLKTAILLAVKIFIPIPIKSEHKYAATKPGKTHVYGGLILFVL